MEGIGKTMTKTEKILAHLKENGSITSWEAIQLYACTRLSSVVFNLRNRGFNIVTEPVIFVDKYGDKNTYAKYVYVEAENFKICS